MQEAQALIELISKEWHVISQNPTLFVTAILISSTIAWKIAAWHYSERMETLKDSKEFYRAKAEVPMLSQITMSQDQYAKVVKSLKQRSDPQRHVTVCMSVGAKENETFALRVMDALKDAGWHTQYDAEMEYPKYRTGIWIFGRRPSDPLPMTGELLKDALLDGGILAKIDPEMEAAWTHLVVGRNET
jgi:hypothetical protein